MAGLAKGLAVLEQFGILGRPLTISEAAEATRLSRATARRCLLTLAELGYLTHEDKYFRPTPRSLRLASAYSATATLPQLAQPFLAELRDELRESVSLAVWQQGESLFVARAETTRLVTTGVRLGVSMPAYATATGHVLLAGLDDDEFDTYLKATPIHPHTPRSLTTTAALRARVKQAREVGMAYTDEELELGMRSLAVPVTDSYGTTRGAMSVSVAAARVNMNELLDHYTAALSQRARALGNLL